MNLPSLPVRKSFPWIRYWIALALIAATKALSEALSP